MVMEESKPRQTRILDRGNYEAPKEVVAFAPPAYLPALPAGQPANRLGLARWLVDPAHPLAARVAVNRHWQLFPESITWYLNSICKMSYLVFVMITHIYYDRPRILH